MRSIERLLLLGERFEDVRQRVAVDTNSVVPHQQNHVAALDPGFDRDLASRLRVLGGVGQQVRDDLGKSRGVAVHHQTPIRDVDLQLVALRLEQGARHLDGAGHQIGYLHRLLFQLHLALGDAGHVEEIVDQAHHVPDLSIDHFAFALDGVRPAQAHQLKGSEDGREGIAQLVTQHRQELVLGAVGDLRGAPGLGQLGDIERHHRDSVHVPVTHTRPP